MDPQRLKERITAFALRASAELTTHDEGLIPALARQLRPGSTVYVAHTPKASLGDAVRTALKLESFGLRASPHLAARRIPSERALREALRELTDGGVEQVLVIAGDCERPLGPFADSLAVMGAEAFIQSGLKRVGVAGHPEGHRAVGPASLWRALREKQEFAQRTGIAVHIVTQFGFNPRSICDWSEHLQSQGISLPVHAGIAGPTPMPKLIRFAMQCGVKASLQSVLTYMPTTLSGVTHAAFLPQEMLAALVRAGAGFERSAIVQPHVFSFGGAMASAKWIRLLGEGAFQVRENGSLKLYG